MEEDVSYVASHTVGHDCDQYNGKKGQHYGTTHYRGHYHRSEEGGKGEESYYIQFSCESISVNF